MNAKIILDGAIEAASNPKIATAVGTSAAAIGAGWTLDMIQGYVSFYAMCIGAITATAVAVVQLIKVARVWKAWRADQPEPKDLA